jgi:hypothetical protein
MVIGTLSRSPEVRAWSLLVGILAAGMFIRVAVREAAKAIEAAIKKWAHKPFEDGFKSGVETGREMEASERFIAATTPETRR